MNRKILPQEALKLIACLTMLIDHIGAVLLPSVQILRVVGRISFPLYCFLLVEGYNHTRNLKKYFNRMFIGCLLAEIPYDLAFRGALTLEKQSVMITLLLGLAMVHIITRLQEPSFSPLVILVFYFIADWTQCDYGGNGILMIALFMFFRDRSDRNVLWTLLLTSICLLIPSSLFRIGPIVLPAQLFGVAAMPFIIMYSGQRWGSSSKASALSQKVFYLFYPIHLAILWLIQKLASI